MATHLDRLFQGLVDSGDVAGTSVRIFKGGRLLYGSSFGHGRLEEKMPISRRTVFRLYSLTKPVTAAAVSLLMGRGELDLKDPVRLYLKGFQNQQVWEDGRLVPARRENTLADLMNMTSGLCYPDGQTEVGRLTRDVFDRTVGLVGTGNEVSTVDFADTLGRLPLVCHPGERWVYGTSADILGAVVEVVSGMRFGDFLEKEFFDPLGMKDTGFWLRSGDPSRLAHVYHWREQVPHLVPYDGKHLVVFGFQKPPAFESGGAGLLSTIDDYGRFANMLEAGGTHRGRRILGAETVAFLRRDQLTDRQRTSYDWPPLAGYGYGNLMRVLVDPARQQMPALVDEYGWDGWAGTWMAIHPRERIVALVFMGRIDKDPDPIRRRLKAILYGHL